jgi:hypothetical protein
MRSRGPSSVQKNSFDLGIIEPCCRSPAAGITTPMASRRVETLPGGKVLVHHGKSGRSTSAKCQKRTSSDCFDDHELDGLLNGNIGAVLPPTVTSYLAVHMGQTPCKCYCKMADEPANSRHYCGRGPHHTSADEHKLRDDDVWLRPMLEMWR